MIAAIRILVCSELAPNRNGIFTAVGGVVSAAGANGTILKRVGSSWVPQQSGTTRTIRALWASTASDIWAGGDSGLLLHYQP
jgi:hypothetical protein